MYQLLRKVNEKNIWWTGILILLVFFLPIFWLGGDAVFETHDQLDETIFLYKLQAKYLGSTVSFYPEMMCGLNKESVTVSAPLFVPVYRYFSTFTAYMIQYVVVGIMSFLGMYSVVRYITNSSILGVISGGFFVFLPYIPVYGLSVMGFPILLYAFINLHNKRLYVVSYIVVVVYVLTSHLALGGFVALGISIVGLLFLGIRHSLNKYVVIGVIELWLGYFLTNSSLIIGKNDVISHRAEFVNSFAPFLESCINNFLYSGDHAPSMHIWMIFPITVIMTIGIVMYFMKKLNKESQKLILVLSVGYVVNILCALWYGFNVSEVVVKLRNEMRGIIHEFQFSRVYLLLPSTWYIMLGVGIAFVFSIMPRKLWIDIVTTLGVMLVLGHGVHHILDYNANIWMRNIRQVNAIARDHSRLDMITWDQCFASDVFDEIKEVIGSNTSDYRVASLGICPVASLMNDFYTIDGYSNNYSLEYKHNFRKIIECELVKSPTIKTYYDTWGSRVYIFAAENSSYLVSKKVNYQYNDLEIDIVKMKELGCKYLFCAGEIMSCEKLSLSFVGHFETEDSYYRIWVYEL